MSDMFLTKDEISELTGRKMKRLQIEQLRKMGLPFWINAVNAPIVCRSAIEGKRQPPSDKTEKLIPRLYRMEDGAQAEKPKWVPPGLREK